MSTWPAPITGRFDSAGYVHSNVLLPTLLALLSVTIGCAGVSTSQNSNNPPGPALAVATSSLPNGTTGVPYSSAVSATGGTPPYAWAIGSGSLPSGLSLSSGGQISGTPSPAGSTNFTVDVTDAAKHSASAQLALTVNTPTSDTATIFEVDGITQTDRPITFGRIFRQSEIAQCPQPMIGGAPLSNYQADVKNRWPDGSVKFAIVSFTQNLGANSATEVAFQNTASCNNSGYLTQSQMTGFNSGNWNAQLVVTPQSPSASAAAVTTDFKAILGGNDPGGDTFPDCKNDYWLKGPVVTAVIVQDCTTAFTYDFGWNWNGANMASDGTHASYTTTSQYASLHPMAVLYFYPSTNVVQASVILENPWPTRIQDQNIAMAIKTGSTASQVWSKTGFTMVEGQRFRKTFWSGMASGHIRIDHNFPYLISTMAVPNYDLAISPTPTTASNNPPDGVESWATWAAGDRGDIGGAGSGLNSLAQDFAGNSEGAPIQREDLLYLYNMGSCGTANSECAKAYQMNTGESGAIDISLGAGNVSGGGGMWNNIGNIPYHFRESRPVADGVQGGGTNWFYCDNFAEKNTRTGGTNPVTGVSGCGNHPVGDASGKSLSKHTHSDDQWGGPGYWGGITNSVTVGTATTAGWSIGGCNHWQDWNYVAYLLTGDYYYLENDYQAASVCLMDSNPDPAAAQGGAGFFAYMSPGGAVIRELAWGLQAVERAAFIAVDRTPEASYYLAQLNSNLEVQEGVMGITGTTLMPSDTSCSAATCSYNPSSANRWNWGRATAVSQCSSNGTCNTIPITLHAVAPGACPISVSSQAYIRDTVTSTFVEYWHYNYLSIVLSQLREAGYTQATAVSQQMQQSLEERVLDSTFNPYLVAAYIDGAKDASGGTACNGNGFNTDPFIATYALQKSSYDLSITNQCTFNAEGNNNDLGTCGSNSGSAWNQQIPCGDHGYSLLARAAGSFLLEFGTSSNDANCPGGTCAAQAAWTWLDGHAPYFANAVTNSEACSAYWVIPDSQTKYALAPR